MHTQVVYKDIQILLGNICNNDCIFCSSKNKNFNKDKFPSLASVKKQIDAHASAGFNSLGFLGGEPTLHPHLLEIVRYARLRGFLIVHLITNGRRLAERQFLEQLIGAGVNRVSVSIHSHLAATEDMFTQRPGGFDQKMHALMNLLQVTKQRRSGLMVSLNMVINKLNIAHLARSVAFFTSMGFKDYRLNFMNPGRKKGPAFTDLVPRYADVLPVFKRIIAEAVKKNVMVHFGDIPFCILHEQKGFYEHVGEYQDYFHQVVEMANRKEKEIAKHFSWKDVRINDLKEKFDNCKKCTYYQVCEGVWKGYADHYGVKEFVPVRAQGKERL